MPKHKKTPSHKRVKNEKKQPNSKVDPEMDVLQERFTTSTVDFNSLLDLVK